MNMIRKILFVLLLLIMSAAAAAYLCFDDETTLLDAQVRTESGATFVSLSQGMVQYELTGPVHAELAVLVHGFSMPAYLWNPTFEALRAACYRVLRFDLYCRRID